MEQPVTYAAPVTTYAAPVTTYAAPVQEERVQTGVRTEERMKDVKFVYGPPSIPGEVISERIVDPSELVEIVEVPIYTTTVSQPVVQETVVEQPVTTVVQ